MFLRSSLLVIDEFKVTPRPAVYHSLSCYIDDVDSQREMRASRVIIKA